MALQARMLYGAGGEVHLTAAADLSPGDVVLAGGRAGVVAGTQPIKTGDRYTAYTKGVAECATASATTFAVGAEIEWDDTPNLCVAATAGTFDLGRAVKAKLNGELVTIVNLNEVNS